MTDLLTQAVTAHQAGDRIAAARLYESILSVEPEQIDALTLLGLLRHEQGDTNAALDLLARAVALDPAYAVAWHNYGIALLKDKQALPASQALLKATQIAPHRLESWLELARAFIQLENETGADQILTELATAYPTNREVPYLQSLLADRQGDDKAALEFALRAGNMVSAEANPWLDLAQLYLLESQYELALAMLDRAVMADPTSIMAAWLQAFSCALPVYRSQAQIQEMLALYTSRVTALLPHIHNLTLDQLKLCEKLIDVSHGLFLAYNGEDVRAAQLAAGAVISAVMQRLYPLAPPAPTSDDRSVLAIVSETFYYHSNMKLRRSWLRRIDRTKFKLVLYHVGDKVDHYTDQIRELCDEFHHIPHDFSGILQQLQQDRPAIIQYTNLGLTPLTLKLAALRLAPVQATTWGHPITSGLPTVDYYLSSDLMEPTDAAAHYSEQLIRLPGLSVVPEEIFASGKFLPYDRAAFGFKDTDVIYLCLQSVQKYLPEDDDIYAAIAAAVPQATFIFIASEAPLLTRRFQQRIAAAFAARGLDEKHHVTFLPAQDQARYRALHQIADITLDSLGWSGANTSFEALELGGLLLTTPGHFMRGRHTAAILKFMGVPELVTADKGAYIAMAVKLGQSADLRATLRQKLQTAKPQLYRDPGLGTALNSFYENALRRT